MEIVSSNGLVHAESSDELAAAAILEGVRSMSAPELREAARQYVRAGLARALDECGDRLESVRWGVPRWERLDDGDTFVLREPDIPGWHACLLRAIGVLEELDEIEPLEEALRSDERISPLLGQLVGTAFGGSSSAGAKDVARRLLWAVAREGDGLSFDDGAFTQAYDTWLSDLLADEYDFRAIGIVDGLRFDGEVDLGGGLQIAQLTDDEITTSLSVGVLTGTFSGSGLAMIPSRAGIRITFTEPRSIGEGSEDELEPVQSKWAELAETAESVVAALRLFRPGHVAVSGLVATRESGSGSGGTSYPIGPRRAPGPTMNLTPGDAAEFSTFWREFRDAAGHPAISAATRRFSFAGERHRPDDDVVDLVIALESLLLSDIEPDHREMRFRMALRGAVYIEHEALSKRDIQKQLRRAYDARSAIVHGAVPNASVLKNANDESVSMANFANDLEALARAAVRKAVAAVAAGEPWPPRWDDLILPD